MVITSEHTEHKENREIAELLKEISSLKEGRPSQSFQKSAEIISTLKVSIKDIDPKSLKGVGEVTSQVIKEYLESGTCSYLDALKNLKTGDSTRTAKFAKNEELAQIFIEIAENYSKEGKEAQEKSFLKGATLIRSLEKDIKEIDYGTLPGMGKVSVSVIDQYLARGKANVRLLKSKK